MVNERKQGYASRKEIYIIDTSNKIKMDALKI